MAPRRREVGLALIAAAISASLSTNARGQESGASDDSVMSEVERLYLKGQEHIEAKQFDLAAQAFHECREKLAEAEEFKTIRESLLLNEVDALILAFNQVRAVDGTHQFEFLDRADESLAKYRADFASAYGDQASITAAVEEMAAELQDTRDAATRKPKPDDPDISVCLQPCLQPCLSPLPPPRGCHGDDDGLAVLGLLALPAIARRRKDVLASVKDRLPKDVVAKLEQGGDDAGD